MNDPPIAEEIERLARAQRRLEGGLDRLLDISAKQGERLRKIETFNLETTNES